MKENPRPKKRPKARGRTKRNTKRYLFERTQELYKKIPGTLARYIRDGVPWME
jgi:hypothetical protein